MTRPSATSRSTGRSEGLGERSFEPVTGRVLFSLSQEGEQGPVNKGHVAGLVVVVQSLLAEPQTGLPNITGERAVEVGADEQPAHLDGQ